MEIKGKKVVRSISTIFTILGNQGGLGVGLRAGKRE